MRSDLITLSFNSITNLPIEQRAIAAFLIYFGVALSKKFWLPDLNHAAFWLADIACFIVLPSVLFFAFNLPSRPSYKPSKTVTKSNDWSSAIFMAVLCSLGVWSIGLITEIIGWRIAQRHPDWLPMVINYLGHIPESGVMKSVVIVYFAVTAGIVEEYVFRGLLGAVIKNNIAFVLSSTLTFAFLHWGGGFANAFSAFFSGLILAIVYARTRDLRVVILAHGFHWLRLLF